MNGLLKEGGAPQSQKFFTAEEMEEFLVNHGHTPVLTNSAYDQLEGQPDVKALPPMPTVSNALEANSRSRGIRRTDQCRRCNHSDG